MPTRPDLEPFLARLAVTPAPPNSVNPWSSETAYGQIRLENLRHYFGQLLERNTTTLLLGEAPGYQGCRRTGVGFTSEPQLISGIAEVGMFGADRGYRLSGEFETMRREPSATIVWGELARHDFVPLIWSAFPFHPHKPGLPNSNRPPKRGEINFGRPIFLDLAEAFQIERVFAVGNVAHASLAVAGIDAPKIRHPAQGGKNDFVAGLDWVVTHPSDLGRMPWRS
ncbi:MAG: uracil-DNA glycosylase [Thermomicrobiales bacterium]|nr:uracil-DNA glycosylase [Thermomicrobiales bacterium]